MKTVFHGVCYKLTRPDEMNVAKDIPEFQTDNEYSHVASYKYS